MINLSKIIILSLFIICIACKSDPKDKVLEENTELIFDAQKWSIKNGQDYVYRSKMLHDVVYNDSVRLLSQNELIALLGKPDRSENNHFYYVIEQERLGFWPLHTKTMVVKFNSANKIEWIKIHK